MFDEPLSISRKALIGSRDQTNNLPHVNSLLHVWDCFSDVEDRSV